MFQLLYIIWRILYSILVRESKNFKLKTIEGLLNELDKTVIKTAGMSIPLDELQ